MKSSLKIFYRGLLISFLGSLPPGMMNIFGFHIYSNEGAGDAILFVTGFMLAEMLIVRIILSAMSWLIRSKYFFHIVEWTTAAALIIFSTVCFITTGTEQHSPAVLPEVLLSPFIMGIVISVINPMHIPFWIGWSAVLMNKGWLRARPADYHFYITGIAIGTVMGFSAFLAGGAFIVRAFASNQYIINCIIGLILFVTAFVHIRKMIFIPVAVRQARLFKQS